MKWILASWVLVWAAIGTIGGYAVAVQHHRVATYKPVPAIVLDRSVGRRDRRDTDGHRRTGFSPVVRYRYTVEGRDYVSDAVHPLTVAWSGFGAHRLARRISEGFRPGQTVTAYVDPRDPSRAFLRGELALVPYAFLLGGLLMVAAAVWLAASRGYRERPGVRRRLIASASLLCVGSGLIAGTHYFVVSAPPHGIGMVTFLTVYTVIALTSLMQTVTTDASTGLLGGLRAGTLLAFLGIWIGAIGAVVAMAVCKLLGLFGHDDVDTRWIGYGVLATIGLLGSAGFLLGALPDRWVGTKLRFFVTACEDGEKPG